MVYFVLNELQSGTLGSNLIQQLHKLNNSFIIPTKAARQMNLGEAMMKQTAEKEAPLFQGRRQVDVVRMEAKVTFHFLPDSQHFLQSTQQNPGCNIILFISCFFNKRWNHKKLVVDLMLTQILNSMLMSGRRGEDFNVFDDGLHAQRLQRRLCHLGVVLQDHQPLIETPA
jgi:hypothetical protein